jgi:hypothetical protein
MVSLDNLSALGEELGGFFSGIQDGLLTLLIGLAIVGGIGMLLYGMFIAISSTVKKGFR